MATQVTPKIHEDIDWYLTSLEREVRWAVDLARRWDAIDEIEQEDLVGEWPLTIDFLFRSLSYRDKGLMTPAQHQRLTAIRAFLHEHKSVLACALGDDNLMLDPPQERYAAS